MFNTIKEINAKNVAKSYIDSCTTQNHIDFMYRYVELYLNKFEDMLGYHMLTSLIQEKEEQINK